MLFYKAINQSFSSTTCSINTFCFYFFALLCFLQIKNYKPGSWAYLGLFLDCLRHSWKQSFSFQNFRIFSSSEGKLIDSGTGSTMMSAKTENQNVTRQTCVVRRQDNKSWRVCDKNRRINLFNYLNWGVNANTVLSVYI